MTSAELHYYKGLGLGVNELKTLLQKKSIDDTIRTKISENTYGGVIKAFTGFGKSYTMLSACKRFREKNDGKITVLVPSLHLKGDAELLLKSIDNIEVIVLNTYTIYNKEDVKTEMLICDEVHHILNDSSEYFSNALDKTDFKYFIGFSASLENRHIAFLAKKGISITFDISLIQGMALKLVPPFIIYNLGIDLTFDEQKQYIPYEKMDLASRKPFVEFEMFVDIPAYEQALFISDIKKEKIEVNRQLVNKLLNKKEEVKEGEPVKTVYNIPKADFINLLRKTINTDLSSFDIRKEANKFITAVRTKNEILSKSINKLRLAKEFIEKNTLKSLVFSPNSIAICDEIAGYGKATDTIAYHSKVSKSKRKKITEAFNQSLFTNLIVIQALDEGFNIKDVKRALVLDIVGVTLRNIQRLGRILRYDEKDPDKRSEMIYIYHSPFCYFDENTQEEMEINPSDYKRLTEAQKDFINIRFINNLNDLTL